CRLRDAADYETLQITRRCKSLDSARHATVPTKFSANGKSFWTNKNNSAEKLQVFSEYPLIPSGDHGL
ncbi:MAG: hypothetical protein WCK86_23115, partial [Planctomycetia bacterium]